MTLHYSVTNTEIPTNCWNAFMLATVKKNLVSPETGFFDRWFKMYWSHSIEIRFYVEGVALTTFLNCTQPTSIPLLSVIPNCLGHGTGVCTGLPLKALLQRIQIPPH